MPGADFARRVPSRTSTRIRLRAPCAQTLPVEIEGEKTNGTAAERRVVLLTDCLESCGFLAALFAVGRSGCHGALTGFLLTDLLVVLAMASPKVRLIMLLIRVTSDQK